MPVSERIDEGRRRVIHEKIFYVDDLTKMIIEEKSYSDWKTACHFGKDIVSIDEFGNVTGCSFDKQSLMKIENPKDILKISGLEMEERFVCPYLKRKIEVVA